MAWRSTWKKPSGSASQPGVAWLKRVMSDTDSQVLICATTSSNAAWTARRAASSWHPAGKAMRADQVVPMVAPASAARVGSGAGMAP
ncbi:hypothetical protein D3C78_1492560 [compost metagenome]